MVGVKSGDCANPPKLWKSRLSVGIARLTGRLDLGLKPPRHPMIPQRLGQLAARLQRFDGARYVALGEKAASLAKRTRIALALFGGIHEVSIGRANS